LSDPGAITRLLHRWGQGDEEALAELTPLVYEKMHQLAQSAFRQEHGVQTLQATGIVNEAYLQLAHANPELENRGHFYALAARMMRRILVDHARRRNAAKRGGGQVLVTYAEEQAVHHPVSEDVLELDQALSALAEQDGSRLQALELHYFGGFSYEEIGEITGVSKTTVKRQLRFSKAWIRRHIQVSNP
jgi:RNA polymerase sigma factor (TIGR02999 family)